MPEYTGKNVLRGYCKHFGVDWRCASSAIADRWQATSTGILLPLFWLIH
ncbi:hypothetical protein RE6C_00471 [Rhodopirellula europaea 6C]|uniref:Uncharacterized protein n=1 Tax=Rhodopirellula europaea 6C TaxID=1263867 RepID=M2BAZ5_9BACT|nr:hypothetical protein RE6C_00471 [Rhodopirellula europaea 6C]